MYARGLSTRDIEALFADESGKSLLSRTAVSEITERLWAEYEGFASRDLSEFEVTYLFVDGIAERLHLGQPREAVLAAWGILADGKKALLHLAPGTKEDTASCREFFQDILSGNPSVDRMNPNLAAVLPLLLPRAIQWARAQERDALLSGRPLTPIEIDFARHVGVRYPERIRLKLVGALPLPNDPELQQAAIQAGLLGPGMVGLTLGYAVFICAGYSTKSQLLRHEFRHVYQYEAAGSISAFLPVYLRQIVQFGYQNAPLEQDARAHEA